MAERVRGLVAPVYLFACLILGGSAQGIWANMALQLAGLGLIAWASIVPAHTDASRGQWPLFMFALLALTIVAFQLVPVPPELWAHFGPRHIIADGYRVLGVARPWQSLSVAPYDSVSALLALIPPLAMLIAVLRLGCRPHLLAVALLVGTFAGILLGALQVSGPDPRLSPWYLYEETNFGLATGFFANANHMADLLVVSLPFLAALLASGRRTDAGVQRYSALVAVVAGATLVVAVGIALNGSLAGYGLVVPVLLASTAIAISRRSRFGRWLAPVAAILIIGAIGWLATTPLSSGASLRSNAQESVQSRAEILRTSMKATEAFMPLGSGVGTFPRVYALFENHERLDPNTYVNHAHNDYVEIALETGVPGAIVLLLFLAWWARAAWQGWTRPDSEPFVRAAVIASAAILLHSLVDFPLRTAAIGACFAMTLGLLLWQRPSPAPDKSHLWPTRHVVID
jgi:O-antigen ligase